MREDEREEMGIGSKGRRGKHGEGEKRREEKRRAGGMRGEERTGEEGGWSRGAAAEEEEGRVQTSRSSFSLAKLSNWERVCLR